MEILVIVDSGVYVVFVVILLDFYKRGLNDGLNYWIVSINLEICRLVYIEIIDIYNLCWYIYVEGFFVL